MKYKRYYSQQSRNRPIVSLDSYKQMEKALNTSKHEYGGYFNHDTNVNELRIDYLTGGTRDSINLPISNFEFHTHPNKCVSKSNCALGMPSIPDMVNIFERCTQNNLCHFVFAHEGTFVVGVKNEYKSLYLKKKEQQKNDRKILKKRLNSLYQKFDNSSKMTYGEFLKIWMKYVNADDSFFRVDFYPKYIGPVVPHL